MWYAFLFITFAIHMIQNLFNKILLLIVLFYGFGEHIYTQNPYTVQISAKDGLPSNSVFQVYQDSKGFVWIANNEGICRYDGFEFVSYFSEKQSSKAGSFIQEDKTGRIWYENFDGYLFFVEKDTLQYFSKSKTFGFVPYCLSDYHLYVLNVDGIEMYDLVSLELVDHIPINLKEIEYAVFKNNALYFISDHILFKLNKNKKLSSNTYFKYKSIKTKQIQFYENKLLVFSKYNESQLIYEFDTSLDFKTSYPFKEANFIQGCAIMNDQIWIYTSQGILMYAFKNNTLDYIGIIYSSKNVSNGMVDQQGNYWIATLNEGILLLPNLQNKVYVIPDAIPSKLISTPNGLVVSTQTGSLLLFNPKTESFKPFYQEEESTPINFVHYDTLQQSIVFTSKGFNLIQFDNQEKKRFQNLALKSIVRIDHKYFGIAVSGFYGLLLDPYSNQEKHSIWDDIYIKNQSDNYPNISNLKINLRAKSIDYTSDMQMLVVVTNEGLFTQHLEQTTELKLNNETFFGEKVFWYKNTIYAQDTKGNFYEIDTSHTFHLMNTEIGIPKFAIKRIKKVGNEVLIATTESIYVYHLDNKTIEWVDFQLNYAYFLDFDSFNDILYILTTDGLIEFAQNTTTKVKKSARFIINYIQVNQDKYIGAPQLVLNNDENNISIHFSVIDYGKTINLPLYYRLNKNEWMLMNKDIHTLLFSSLSYGKYELEFKIGDQKIDDVIRFEILSPYWLRWWFIVFVVALFLLIGFLFYKWRMNRLSNQIILLKEKVQLEQSLSKSILTAVKSQMNPHFFYNALNTIQAYIYTNDNKKANTYLAKFSKLTRTVLEMSERDTITLTEEFTSLNLYLELEKMRFSKNFEFTVNKESIFNPEIIEIPPMLIQPYVENAIKHGLLHREGHRQLDIDFKLNDKNVLVVTIDDNGIGRKKSEELNQLKKDKSRSFSTAANKKRLEILNSSTHQAIEIIDKYDKEGNATGTTVILNIQFN
jgi:hypothetical protein